MSPHRSPPDQSGAISLSAFNFRSGEHSVRAQIHTSRAVEGLDPLKRGLPFIVRQAVVSPVVRATNDDDGIKGPGQLISRASGVAARIKKTLGPDSASQKTNSFQLKTDREIGTQVRTFFA